MALPIPKPARNTARIIENVYVDAPKVSDRRRVQTTSDAKAHAPEMPIAMKTARVSSSVVGALVVPDTSWTTSVC